MHDTNDIKHAVRERYAGLAAREDSCCAPKRSCGCGEQDARAELGYSAEDIAAIPEGADLGLGCGNPLAMLQLQPGETVMDLGSGGGIDCFVAAKRVGPTGHVIGVDMTPEMIERARRNGAPFPNVEFRLGEIEHLPAADATVDAIISNCVINLVPDKAQAFREAFRVLKPGGRLSVSDIVLLREVPVAIRDSVDAYVACLSGAVLKDDYLGMLAVAGFADVELTEERGFELDDVVAADVVEEYMKHADVTLEDVRHAASAFRSIRVQARKAAQA